TIDLTANENGYTIASQVNYRIAGISNFGGGYSLIGATYTAEIPGYKELTSAPKNNSAQFTADDLVVVCANNNFSYSFAAQDADSDQLQYSFCDAYASGTQGNPSTPPPPPYESVPYGSSFTATSPLGSSVHVNPATGLLTGIAPSAGIYVVTVCVEEIRNGVIIARQRKDIQVNVSDCTLASASLLPQYLLCKESNTLSASNLSTSPLIHSYNWSISSAAGAVIYNTSNSVVNYTFQDTGTYHLHLAINKGETCTDSTSSVVKVYPGLKPAFSFSGVCAKKPTLFKDNSTTLYGSINSWTWDFGEPGTVGNTSSSINPAYTYNSNGTRNVMLIVNNINGCIDTAVQTVTIIDKPPLNLAFKDTLICKGDTLQLASTASGAFEWQPSSTILNSHSANPFVFPATTTTYNVQLDDNGCKNIDSVKVRVVDFVTISARADTSICSGDNVMLSAVTNGLHYQWQPAARVINANLLSTTGNPLLTTNFLITASIGHCSATDSVLVKVMPYPTVNAGADTTICFNSKVQLKGYTNAVNYTWTPAASLSSSISLFPEATPARTTEYILTATNTDGCTKPATDKVVITVLPKIAAFAGNDTVITFNQPLQLNASGGNSYLWSPGNYLSSVSISNPIAKFNSNSEDVLFKVLVFNEIGCMDSDFVFVRIFKTEPTVFVPSAFTPNGDGLNETIKPIAVGMNKIEYFRIYNRWGQLVFSSTENGKGWNGKIGGQLQETSTFVWEVKALDYLGRVHFSKGLFTLIR
ncbi:MAG: T9SS type B sorting domain-containing protein, partial [Candidatus Dadabacteria bacterium]